MSNFKSKESNGVHFISCPPMIDISELEELTKVWSEMPCNAHVFDMKSVVEVSPRAYRPFSAFNQTLKANSKRMFVMNVSPHIAVQFSQDGLNSIFIPFKEESSSPQKSTGNKHQIDVGLINPFVTATLTVLQTQASTEIKGGKPYLKKHDENLPIEIAGVISLTNPAFTGSIALCFRSQVFLKIYENMVGEKHDAITAEIEDAAGEILNIIFGQAKTILNDEKGYSLEKTLPTVLSGEKLKLRHKSQYPSIVIPFESSAGSFHIEIALEKEGAPHV